ncbi:MAG TPA: hypothetical protein VNI83_04595 [Vicinamibacterales bacterium]|nr:hypothetical protein [Vicinamibacterales bacterium]
MSRLCEEFHCLPSAALAELASETGWLALDILPLRAYARAKEVYDSAPDKDQLPKTPLLDLVEEITFALAAERWRARKAEAS